MKIENGMPLMLEEMIPHEERGWRPASLGECAAEIKRLRAALDEMDPTDREVLALRHFEQLTNGEAALVLGIQERAAAKRYVRALKRLKDLLASLPAGLTGLMP